MLHAKLLYAEDVAELLGVSTRQALRQLIEWQERYGVAVVGETAGSRGPRRYTTLAGLEAVGPKISQRISALAEDVEELKDRIAAVDRRLDAAGIQ